MPRGCEWGAREDGSRLRADTAGAGAAAGTDAGARADETETDAAGGTVGAAGTDGGARARGNRGTRKALSEIPQYIENYLESSGFRYFE